MEQLIKLSEGKFPVHSFELYQVLKLDSTHHARWIRKYILANPFAKESIDYQLIPESLLKRSGRAPIGYYKLTIEFAKNICMMSNSKNGQVARDYFIACEKKALEVTKPEIISLPITGQVFQTPKTFPEALRQLADTIEAKEGLQLLIEESKPKIESYDKFMNLPDEAISIKTAARLLNVYRKDKPKELFGQNTLYDYLRDINVLQNNNLPYQEHSRYFIVKKIEKTVRIRKTGDLEVKHFTQTFFKPKGLERLRKRMIKDGFIFEETKSSNL